MIKRMIAALVAALPWRAAPEPKRVEPRCGGDAVARAMDELPPDSTLPPLPIRFGGDR